MTTYPDDEDGAVLADLAAQGVDMTLPVKIEFPVIAPDEDSAHAIANALINAGYETHIEYDDGELDEEDELELDPDDEEEFGPAWDVYATVMMVPDHAELIRIQADLDRLAEPLGGNSDGWGVLMDADPDAEAEGDTEPETV